MISSALDVVLELSKIFKYSAKKKAMLLKKNELAPGNPGVKPLSHMMDSESRISAISDHKLCRNDSAGRNRVQRQLQGMSSQRSVDNGNFHFLFDAISEKVFSITDKLSKALQMKDLSAIAARGFASITMWFERVEK